MDNNSFGNSSDAQSVIKELQRLKQQFNEMAKTVDTAIDLLRVNEMKRAEGESKIRMLTLENQAVAFGQVLAKGKKTDFIFVVDGTASMNGTPLAAALDAVLVADKGAKKVNAAPVKAALYGDQEPMWIKGDLQDQAYRTKIDKWLGQGTDLHPTVGEMEKIAAVNTLDKKATHFVLISDGDLIDFEKSKEVLTKMLRQSRKATLDVVIIDEGYHAELKYETLLKELAADFPKQVSLSKINMTSSTKEDMLSTEVQKAVINIMASRVQPVVPKNKPSLNP